MIQARSEIEHLKQNWLSDPIWDIEETEGFEAHREELLAFRHKWEEIWDNRRTSDLNKKAEKIGVPGNITLAEYIEGLESQIIRLETEIRELQNRE